MIASKIFPYLKLVQQSKFKEMYYFIPHYNTDVLDLIGESRDTMFSYHNCWSLYLEKKKQPNFLH